MDDPAGLWIMTVVLIGSGAILVWIGRKQRAGTLRRNWVVGLRTSETLRDDASWDAAHRATAGLMVAAGVPPLLVGLALPILPLGDTAAAIIILVALGVMLALVLTAGVRGHQIAAQTDAPTGQPSPPDQQQ